MVVASLSSEDQRYLRDAVASGRFSSEQEAIAAGIRLLREREDTSEQSTPRQTVEDRLMRLREWMSEPRPGNAGFDDSRDSIYEGCGE